MLTCVCVCVLIKCLNCANFMFSVLLRFKIKNNCMFKCVLTSKCDYINPLIGGPNIKFYETEMIVQS